MDLEQFTGYEPDPGAQSDAESRPGQPPVAQPIRAMLAGLVAILTLAGCGTAPFVDGRREAGQTTPVGVSTPDRVAVCYSSQSATPAQVIALAETECAKTNRRAQFDGQDPLRCALLAPTRAFFKCVGP